MKPYRGIPIAEKLFVYGWLFMLGDHAYIIPLSDNFTTPSSFICGFIEVIPESVGQFTGLKDKNGKDIYEGDICKVLFGDQELIYVCEWYEEIGAWVFRGNGEWLMWEDVFDDVRK